MISIIIWSLGLLEQIHFVDISGYTNVIGGRDRKLHRSLGRLRLWHAYVILEHENNLKPR